MGESGGRDWPPPAGGHGAPTDTDASPAWVRRYLALLGVAPASPGLAALTALTRAHVSAIPLENITALLRRRDHPGRPVPPSAPDAILDRWATGRGGGLCFEIAPLFGRLLGALGYRAYPILGAIIFPGSHQALVVHLAGRRYLVDVGCGAPLFAPIPLENTVEVRHAGLAYRFRPADTGPGWVQDRRIGRSWVPFCRYDLTPAADAACLAAYQRHHTPGASWVVGSVLLVRCAPEVVAVLRGAALTRYTAAGKRVERLGAPGDDERLAEGVFGLPHLPLAAGRAALAALAAGAEATVGAPSRLAGALASRR